MRPEEKLREAVARLRALYGRLEPPGDTSDPFKVLVRTILSQNTSYKNELKAYRALEERLGVEPEKLARADVALIAECIRPAGQHRQRAIRIRQVAEAVLERYGGDLWALLKSEPLEAVRKELMGLPGVGRKTADIVLLFCARRPVFPVDRHIKRIFLRLGLIEREDYEAARALAEEALEPGDYLFAHLAFIRLGREVCRARRPSCPRCPLSDLCDRAASGEHALGGLPLRGGR